MPSQYTVYSSRPRFQPLLASSHQAETSAPRELKPQVPASAAGSSVFWSNIKTFFYLGLKTKCSTYSHFPTLLFHWFFALSLYRPANCTWISECKHVMWWLFDFIWAFILAEFWVFFQRAVITTFHHYRRLLEQEERVEDSTQENEVQLCFICGPVFQQQPGSDMDGLATASEALTFLRVLVAVELVFSLGYRDFLFPTLAWLGYTYGSFSHVKAGSAKPRTSQAGPLERHMWRVIELSILNWQAWLILMQEKHSGWRGWDWMWLSVTVHATTGLLTV